MQLIILLALAFQGCKWFKDSRGFQDSRRFQLGQDRHEYDIYPGVFETVPPFEEGFHPIRVHVELIGEREIHGDVRESIGFLRQIALPHVTRLVSRVFQVRDVSDDADVIRIGAANCKYQGIDSELRHDGLREIDLIAFVELDDKCHEEGTLMYTNICQWDPDIGRPQVGRIVVCVSWLEDEWTHDTPKRENVIIRVLFHEFIHLLGFHPGGIPKFRHPNTLEPRMDPSRVSTVYTCRIDRETKRAKVDWDIQYRPGMEDVYFHTFLPGVMEAIDARGLKAEECRCPLDPKRVYTASDVEYCIRHPNHCAVAIVTEKVVEKTREYFACPEAKGMEIENGDIEPSCNLWFKDAHWKTRLVRGELMNFRKTGRFDFITPMTLALFEDSGWYKVDYSVFEPPVPGITWGHLKGCAFLNGKCIERGRVVDKDAFCLPNQNRNLKCSNDALTFVFCMGADTPERTNDYSRTALPQYIYNRPSREYVNEFADYDHCPTFQDISGYSCTDNAFKTLSSSPGPNSRCFMDNGRPDCYRTKCARDKKSYLVESKYGPIACRQRGEIRSGVECADPKIICGNLNAFHLIPGTLSIPNADL